MTCTNKDGQIRRHRFRIFKNESRDTELCVGYSLLLTFKIMLKNDTDDEIDNTSLKHCFSSNISLFSRVLLIFKIGYA